MRAHDPADTLLVDATAGGRREMHADRGARGVPTFGEKHRVDENVDLSALVRGECLGEADGRRTAADRLSLQTCCAKLTSEVVGVLYAGRVDDPRRIVEADAIQARSGLVDELVVEDLGEDLLVVVAADDRHGGNGCGRAHAQAAQGSDEAAPGGIAER